MNELQKRFAKKSLSPQQKRLIVEAAKEQHKPKMRLVPFVGTGFIVVLAAVLLLVFSQGSSSMTTAALDDKVLSQLYFLNLCNLALIVAVSLYVRKLLHQKGRAMSPLVQSLFPVLVIALLIGYLIVESNIGDRTYYKELMFLILFVLITTLSVWFPLEWFNTLRAFKSKLLFAVAWVLLIPSFIISWTIDPLKRMQANTLLFEFPLNIDGAPYVLGNIGAWLFVLGIILLLISINRYRIIAFVVTLFILLATPGTVAYVKQTFFAENAAAVHYLQDGYCKYDYWMNGSIDFSCSFTLTNRSNEPATFNVEIVEVDRDLQDIIDKMNAAGPFTYTLQPKEQRFVEFDEYTQSVDFTNDMQGGGEMKVNLKIFDDEFVGYQ